MRNVSQQHVYKTVSEPKYIFDVAPYPSIERIVPSAMGSLRLHSLQLINWSAEGVM